MIHIKQIEKDALILGLAQAFVKSSSRSLSDYITDFNQEEFTVLSNNLPFMKDAEAADKALGYLVNDVYKRVVKKFPVKGDQ